MAKLKLDVDTLEVQSFETAQAKGERGTVAAHALAPKTPYCSADCTEEWTCGIWCPPTTDPQNTEPCLC